MSQTHNPEIYYASKQKIRPEAGEAIFYEFTSGTLS